MISKKYYILLFQYNYIHLFTEINGKITKINFSSGREKLSNCISFSYDKEDLIFLPDGDPFDVNSNSSFSDYLDFAGYHFDAEQAIEEIVRSIIREKMIPCLGKNEDILVCSQSFYYEVNFDNKDDDSQSYYCDSIEGHNVYTYDFIGLLNVSKRLIKDTISCNLLFGYPFISVLFARHHNDENSFLVAPTIEKTAVDEVNPQHTSLKRIPEDLLRNIKNRIVVSKLFNLHIPETAVYQNRIINIAHEEIVEMFDEVVDKAAKLILQKMDEKITDDPMFIFDFGMHPVIKNTFLSLTENPMFIDSKYNLDFICFILRSMIIEHNAIHDNVFRAVTTRLLKNNP